ncbi:MAG: hypothetical protein ACREP9_20070, partial [Candidatus Dormibacteraceae bacterium]
LHPFNCILFEFKCQRRGALGIRQGAAAAAPEKGRKKQIQPGIRSRLACQESGKRAMGSVKNLLLLGT